MPLGVILPKYRLSPFLSSIRSRLVLRQASLRFSL